MSHINQIVETLIKYLEVRGELVKIQVKEQVTEYAASLILFFVMLFVCLLFVLTASIVLGIYLNYLFESRFLGFIVTLAVQLLFFFIIYIQRHGIVKAIIYKFVFGEHLNKQKKSEKNE